MTNAISNIVDDKRYIKSELTTDSSVKKVPFFFASKHKVTNDIVKQEVKTYDGTNNVFILNNPTYGILGQNKLGDSASSVELRYVQPSKNLFKEPFEDTEFINATSGTIANSIITLDNAESLISKTFWKNPTVTPQSITFVNYGENTLGENEMKLGSLGLGVTTFGGGNTTLQISPDGGNTWTSVSTLTSHPLPSDATELRYKITSNADGVTFDNVDIKINT